MQKRSAGAVDCCRDSDSTVSANSIEECNAEQIAWLKKDLAAVDREKTPWVIAMSRKLKQSVQDVRCEHDARAMPADFPMYVTQVPNDLATPIEEQAWFSAEQCEYSKDSMDCAPPGWEPRPVRPVWISDEALAGMIGARAVLMDVLVRPGREPVPVWCEREGSASELPAALPCTRHARHGRPGAAAVRARHRHLLGGSRALRAPPPSIVLPCRQTKSQSLILYSIKDSTGRYGTAALSRTVAGITTLSARSM